MRSKPILIAITLLWGAGCATSGVNQWQPNIISIQQEDQLGQQFAKQAEKEHPVLQDAMVDNYLTKIGQKLLKSSPEVNFDYTFKLVDSNELNAFALPGGHVYVNRGLIQAADNEAELAGVIAHEIGHVIARHGTERLTSIYGYNLALSLALGKNPNQLAVMAANLFGQAGILAYSRSQETESDALGVKILHDAGYDPNAMISFFEKLKAQQKREPTILDKYMSSHPLTEDRIKHVGQLASEYKPEQGLVKDTQEFQKIKAHLSGMSK